MTISKEWQKRIAAAQRVKTAVIGGVTFPRIPHESADGYPCGDCAVAPGQYHVEECDQDRCPRCKVGQAAFGCDCLEVH